MFFSDFFDFLRVTFIDLYIIIYDKSTLIRHFACEKDVFSFLFSLFHFKIVSVLEQHLSIIMYLLNKY